MAELRTRREPPPLRPVAVRSVERRTPHLVRLTLGGPALEGFEPPGPAASVRLLLPSPTTGALVLPTWDGNEFLDADGGRPLLRTLTPLRFDPAAPHLDVEVVLHGDAPLSAWATAATEGSPVAVSGPGRAYEVDPAAPAFLVAGDESALPAITTLLPALPPEADVQVLVEVRADDARVDLPPHPRARVRWLVAEPGAGPGDAMVAAVTAAEVPADARVWVAGEAAAVQRVRRHLFEDRQLPRGRATVRGYWKRGRAEGGTG